MGGLFSLDNPIMQLLNKIIDCIFLSLLWIIFSIPIITFGASTSALYYTANKSIRNSRGYIWQQFWHGFKSSFKQSTILWLIFAVIGLILYNDIRIMSMFVESGVLSGNIATAAQTFFVVVLVIELIVLMYILVYIARFSAPLKAVVKNCFYMTFRHFLKTIAIVAIVGVAGFIIWLIPLTAILLPTFTAVCLTYIFESIFVKYMSEEDLQREEKLNGKEYL